MGTSLPTCSPKKAHATEVQIHIVFYQTLPFVNLIPNRNLQNYCGNDVTTRGLYLIARGSEKMFRSSSSLLALFFFM